MSTADKLTYLNTTKSKIKDSINLTGVGITTEPFRNYAIMLKDKLAESIGDAETFREVLINNFPKDSYTGTSMSFDAYSSWIDYTLEGQTSQDGTPTPSSPIEVKTTTGRQVFQTTNGIDTQSYEINLGKNLFNINDTAFNTGEARITIENDKIISTAIATGNNRYTAIIISNSDELLGKTLTLSGKFVESASNKGTIRFFQCTKTSAGSVTSVSNATVSTSGSSATFTAPSEYASGKNAFCIVFYANTSGTLAVGDYVEYSEVQLEVGNTKTSYSSYFTPIFLGEIGNYKDFIRKGTGKNLFDKDNANVLNNTYIDGNNNDLRSATNAKTLYIPIIGGKTYTVSKIVTQRFIVATTHETPVLNATVYNRSSNNTGTVITITTTAEDKYLCVFYFTSNDTISEQTILDSIMIEESSQATEYEPYGYKDKWYLYKTIGKVVLNGSESGWGGNSPATGIYRFYIVLNDILAYTDTSRHIDRFISNYFNGNISDVVGGQYQYQTRLFFQMDSNTYSSLSAWTTWLSTHPLSVYYVLNTPTITEITEENYPELLEQLEEVKPLNGLNMISITGDLPFISTITYLKKEG